MGKIVNKIMLLLVYLVLCAGSFELLLIIGAFIKDAKYKDIYIFSIVILISLVFLFLLRKLFFDTKPKFKDGKYVWRDGRIYEGDWDKKYGANGKGKLTWADGSCYEGEFKNGHLSGKGKKVCPSGEIYEGDWENDKGNGKGKLTGSDGSCYEGEFKDGEVLGKGKKILPDGTIFEGIRVNGFLEGKGKIVGEDGGVYEGEFKKGKPDGMGIIKMVNGYYYEGELKEGKRIGKFKKEILPSGTVIEGEFMNNGDGTYDGYGKTIYHNGDTIEEGTFYKGKLNGEGKIYLKNGEYLSGSCVNGELNGLAMYHFKDGSYYEGNYKQGWQGIGTYVTKKGDRYTTEFPYDVISIFQYRVSEKIKEINKNLDYIPKSEKERIDEKNMYLKILEKGTLVQKDIARLSLEEYEKDEMLLDFIKTDNSIGNVLKYHKGLLKSHEEGRENFRRLTKKHHIKIEEKSSCYSYGQFLNRLDGMYGKEHDVNVLYIKIDEFLNSKNILNFIINREKKEKERVIMIDEFSVKYGEYIKTCLDWRDYEKKFWKRNFKPDKNSY